MIRGSHGGERRDIFAIVTSSLSLRNFCAGSSRGANYSWGRPINEGEHMTYTYFGARYDQSQHA